MSESEKLIEISHKRIELRIIIESLAYCISQSAYVPDEETTIMQLKSQLQRILDANK